MWQFDFFRTEDRELDRQYAAFASERHVKFERRRLERLDTKLQQFYSQHIRWPTNHQEFAFFVTGEERAAIDILGITLLENLDGGMEIALVKLPDEKRSVTKPQPARIDEP